MAVANTNGYLISAEVYVNTDRLLIKDGLVYRNEERRLERLDVLCEDGCISSLGVFGELDSRGVRIIDASGMAIYPALVDVHTHGIGGYDFVTADRAELAQMARAYAVRGVTTVMPTLASAPYERMIEQARLIGEFCPEDDESLFCGVHLEGRYLNPKRCGAHASELLSGLRAEELDNCVLRELSKLHITAAFELDTDESFARKAWELGATLAWGHTEATKAELLYGERNRITTVSHLYNAMPPMHHRDGGIVAHCLTSDGIAELICDTIHVSEDMIKLAYRAKGVDKISLISDSISGTDAPDGEYFIAGNRVIVSGTQARMLDGTLAGSTLTLDRAVELFRRICGITRDEAIISASETPAREVGIFDCCGSIDIGKRADMLFASASTEEFLIENVILRGKPIKLPTRRTI